VVSESAGRVLGELLSEDVFMRYDNQDEEGKSWPGMEDFEPLSLPVHPKEKRIVDACTPFKEYWLACDTE
jgi:hypothetical protein